MILAEKKRVDDSIVSEAGGYEWCLIVRERYMLEETRCSRL